MRASATSRISSAHAAHQPSQAANSNKADDTSPFAMLLAGTAPKTKADNKDSGTHDDNPSDDKAVKADTRTDNKTDAALAKPKSDNKSDDKTAKAEATDAKPQADDAAAATNDMPVMDVALAAPIQPQTQAQSAPPGEDGEETVKAAAAANPAAGAPAPQGQDQADAQDIKDKAGVPAKPVKDAAKADAKPAPVKAAKTQAAKADDIKPGAAQAEDAKPALPQATEAPAHAKSADAPVTAPTLAAQAAPQAAAPADAPNLTQHVQVTAKPAPNLPALAVEIASKSQAGSKQFDIRLDPPELGRVEVRLSIDAAGKASAHLTADQPQTLDLLRKDSTSLTQALRDAGLDVSQDGLNFSLRQQAGDAHQNQGQSGRSAGGRGAMLTASKSLDATSTSAAYRAPADGRLDIKV